LWLPSASATFHGRDIFAPVAAALASGKARPEDVGPILEKHMVLRELEPHETERNHWQGMVLSVDHFGNVITNFALSKFRAAIAGKFSLEASSGRVTEARRTFAEAEPHLCFAYAGSSGYLEIGMSQGDAGGQLVLKPGDRVELWIAD
jgi:S-adenosyl-L-methionine hydrolase (adenosine-forming)